MKGIEIENLVCECLPSRANGNLDKEIQGEQDVRL